MLELVRNDSASRTRARGRVAEDFWDLDEPHEAIWAAVRHLFPAHAMVDQVDHGCLLISWSLRDGRRACTHFAAPVMIKLSSGFLLALWTCDRDERKQIAELQVETVREALEHYDPHSRVPTCGVILLGD